MFGTNVHSEPRPKKVEAFEDLGGGGRVESRKRLGDKVVQFGMIVFQTLVYLAYPMHFAVCSKKNANGVESIIL